LTFPFFLQGMLLKQPFYGNSQNIQTNVDFGTKTKSIYIYIDRERGRERGERE